MNILKRREAIIARRGLVGMAIGVGVGGLGLAGFCEDSPTMCVASAASGLAITYGSFFSMVYCIGRNYRDCPLQETGGGI